MEYICITADQAHRHFYEGLHLDEGRFRFVALAEAYESVGACGVSIVILDAGYTPDAGLLLLKRLKQCCVSVPIIFLTDVSSEDVVIAAFKAGAREYFRKPVDQAELQATITDLASLRRATVDSRIPHTTHPAIDSSPLRLSSDLPDGILKTVNYLKGNLSEKIYLDEVADKAGMSKFHFCRIFKDHVGMTPMQFLTISRIERAKVLMRKGGTSITSVIYKVGFNDVSEFNRQFKKVTGQTPSAFKESLKKDHGESLAC